MQTLEIISVNVWQILISLCNLLLLFFLLKKFLYQPVRRALAARQKTLDEHYAAAETAEADAGRMKAEWEEKMQGADEEAARIRREAEESAARKEAARLAEAEEKAARIVSVAEAEAEEERRKAEDGIRHEIVEVSAALSEKILGREIKEEDHRRAIDDFLSELGEDHDGRQ